MEELKKRQEAELEAAKADAASIRAEADSARLEVKKEKEERERMEVELAKKIADINKVDIKEDEDDVELAGTYSKNNRTLIEN